MIYRKIVFVSFVGDDRFSNAPEVKTERVEKEISPDMAKNFAEILDETTDYSYETEKGRHWMKIIDSHKHFDYFISNE